jgi:hypothetical protein
MPNDDATGVDLLDADIRRACLAAAAGAIAARNEALRGVAVAGAAAGVASIRRTGSVEMPLSGGRSSFPAAGVKLAFEAWLRAHGVAQALRDTDALTVQSGAAVIEQLGSPWNTVARALLTPDVELSQAVLDLGRGPIDRDWLALKVVPLLKFSQHERCGTSGRFLGEQ